MVVTITRTGWKHMLRNSVWLPELLDLVERSVLTVPAWLQARGISVVDNYFYPTALPRAS